MSSIRYGWVILLIIVAVVFGWVGAFYAAENGWATPSLGYPSMVTITVAIILELALGLRVLKDRERPVADRMNPVAAARTLVLAQAGTYAGAGIAGWHAGILLHRLPETGFGTTVAAESMVQVIAALVLVVVGFVVEQWCRIPPEDTEGNGKQYPSSPNISGPQPTVRQADNGS